MVEECDVDEFILMYIKNCIEHDQKYQWYEAPMIRVSLTCERCRDVRLAAELFQRRKIASLKGLLDGLIDRDRLTFISYRYIFESFIGMLSDRMEAEADDESNSDFSILCFPLMAIISFTGIYARRLVELDYGDINPIPALGDQSDDAVLNRRDYRREIYQLSIYSSHMLQNKFYEFKTRYSYSWNKFVDDTRNWLQIMYEDERETVAAADKMSSYGGQLMCFGAVVIVATVALVAVNHHRITFKWFYMR